MYKRIFCKHCFVPLRNIHGDEINITNARSEWVCHKCQKRKYESMLISESDFIESKRDIKIKEILDGIITKS
jgi:RNase P subunit RPR2